VWAKVSGTRGGVVVDRNECSEARSVGPAADGGNKVECRAHGARCEAARTGEREGAAENCRGTAKKKINTKTEKKHQGTHFTTNARARRRCEVCNRTGRGREKR
jgi:hypothetical protein